MLLSRFSVAVSARPGWISALVLGTLAGCGASDANLLAAKKCMESAEWGKAIDYLDEGLRQNPKSGKALALRGQALLKLGRYSLAIDDLQRAQKIAPTTSNNLLLVEAYFHRGEFALAEAAATNAPQSRELLLLRGRARLALTKLDAAAADFRAALQLDPKNEETLFYLGAASLERGEFLQAEDYLTQSIAIRPNQPKAFLLRALARTKLQRPEGAEADRNTAAELDPSYKFAESAEGITLLRTIVGDKADLSQLDARQSGAKP